MFFFLHLFCLFFIYTTVHSIDQLDQAYNNV